MGAFIPVSEDLSVLARPFAAGGRTFRNRLAIQPMEGCDGTENGAPGELTVRRYARFAAGGAGLIWFEAVAVIPEGRANPRQLMLTAENLDEYKRLVDGIRGTSLRENGFEPLVIMQATHSGRYSKPNGAAEPIIACNNPFYEKDRPIDAGRIVSDEYLDALPERYAESARLAGAAGFDGVDVKACHRYLINELLSARTRENSRYGGDFGNRSRLYINAVEAVRAAVPGDMTVTSRLNLYDGVEFPYGFGVSAESGLAPELSEPLALVKKLSEAGLWLIDLTVGNPYVNPHVNRPFDSGPYDPPEHPFEGLGRMYSCVKAVKDANPGMVCVASGLSYTRQFSPYVAAGLIESGAADLAGYGREAFAYPDFARDILQKGAMDKNRCCISCGKCSRLMRAGSTAGCAVRDGVYTEIYRRDV
ncbi:MAG: flavin oxidoreductase/NADH oxidase [Firmicutes bacterium]|nr:flavin oxidoreductase/NADH oxidase [Bacillota bacterium]